MPYKDNKSFIEWERIRREERKERLIEYKRKIGQCQLCGWSEHPEILEPDHIDKATKKFKFSIGSIGNYSWETILKELEKCRLICPNCHRWRHYNEKEWFREKASLGGKTTELRRKALSLGKVY